VKHLILLTALLATPAFAEDPEAKAREADAKAKVEALKTAMKGKDDGAKTSAIADCGAVNHALTAIALAPILGDPSDDLRLAAAKALGDMKSLPEAAKALHGGLKANESKASVLQAIFASMGDVNHPASVAVCRDYVNDRIAKRDSAEQPGINEAISCLGKLKWKASVTALIEMAKRNEVANGARGGKGLRAKSDIRMFKALVQLTGESFESSEAWDDWWKKNAGKFNDDLTAK